jgi:thioredoxin-dependent peroxiredoxin
MIDVGSQFPDFSLPDQDGKVVSLADLKGKKAVIYFYPKDDTTGCTAQACSFRDRMPDIEGARVIGVSPDSSKSHRKFADKFGLSFTLLADTERSLIEACGLWIEKTLYGKKYMGVDRTTYLLDEDGKVIRVWRKVKPQDHADEIVLALAT